MLGGEILLRAKWRDYVSPKNISEHSRHCGALFKVLDIEVVEERMEE
jgi:hypothetical protein